MFEESGQRKVLIHVYQNSHAIKAYASNIKGIFAFHATHAITSHEL
jgi:hypothetical protein